MSMQIGARLLLIYYSKFHVTLPGLLATLVLYDAPLLRGDR